MTTNFRQSSIARLIAQRGEFLQFCVETEQGDTENLDWGIVAEKGLVCRQVRGYALGESTYEIGLSGGTKSLTGNYNCWIMAADIRRDEFTGSARMIRGGKIYQIQYQSFVLDRGRGQLHSIKLIANAQAESINMQQPDEVFDDLS